MKETNVARKREEYSRLLSVSLARAVEKLSASADVKRISLFGSYARKTAGLFTDLDILVIMDSNKPFLERTRDLYAHLALPVDADILCYTPDEFRRLKRTPFLQRILAEEVVLHEKDQH